MIKIIHQGPWTTVYIKLVLFLASFSSLFTVECPGHDPLSQWWSPSAWGSYSSGPSGPGASCPPWLGASSRSVQRASCPLETKASCPLETEATRHSELRVSRHRERSRVWGPAAGAVGPGPADSFAGYFSSAWKRKNRLYTYLVFFIYWTFVKQHKRKLTSWIEIILRWRFLHRYVLWLLFFVIMSLVASGVQLPKKMVSFVVFFNNIWLLLLGHTSSRFMLQYCGSATPWKWSHWDPASIMTGPYEWDRASYYRYSATRGSCCNKNCDPALVRTVI